ncbi:thioredoxin [Candidatus Pacearchaeota archaeon]|nr:thioredoxin [Candidatus Pacearchaeota archaeon]
MSKNIIELTSKNFNSFIKEGLVVVDFWAEWCGPCKIMEPVYEEVAKELKGEVKFGKVNVDKNTELAQNFFIMSIPTVIFFKKGKHADRVIGVMSREELIKKIGEVK